MTNTLINDIIRFSMSRKKISQKIVYLVKGFAFAAFLEKGPRKARENEDVSSSSQAGDDIYPIF